MQGAQVRSLQPTSTVSEATPSLGAIHSNAVPSVGRAAGRAPRSRRTRTLNDDNGDAIHSFRYGRVPGGDPVAMVDVSPPTSVRCCERLPLGRRDGLPVRRPSSACPSEWGSHAGLPLAHLAQADGPRRDDRRSRCAGPSHAVLPLSHLAQTDEPDATLAVRKTESRRGSPLVVSRQRRRRPRRGVNLIGFVGERLRPRAARSSSFDIRSRPCQLRLQKTDGRCRFILTRSGRT